MVTTFVQRLLTVFFWIGVLCISTYFFVSSVSPYFTGTLSPRLASEKWWLVAHFSGATCTLFLGPLQFWSYFRNKFPKWHRLAGKFYIGGSILSALMVFYLLTNYTLPGAIPSLGFLAVIWLVTTLAAYWFVLHKNFRLHREFMIRSYVCSLAFIFIRLFSFIDGYTGIFDFIENEETRFTVYEWMCWVYPLLITEFVLSWRASILSVRLTKN